MCKTVEIVEVIKVTTTEGNGDKGNPIREVNQYWSKDGKLLFKENPEHIRNVTVHVTNSNISEKSIRSLIERVSNIYP